MAYKDYATDKNDHTSTRTAERRRQSCAIPADPVIQAKLVGTRGWGSPPSGVLVGHFDDPRKLAGLIRRWYRDTDHIILTPITRDVLPYGPTNAVSGRTKAMTGTGAYHGR